MGLGHKQCFVAHTKLAVKLNMMSSLASGYRKVHLGKYKTMPILEKSEPLTYGISARIQLGNEEWLIRSKGFITELSELWELVITSVINCCLCV